MTFYPQCQYFHRDLHCSYGQLVFSEGENSVSFSLYASPWSVGFGTALVRQIQALHRSNGPEKARYEARLTDSGLFAKILQSYSPA